MNRHFFHHNFVPTPPPARPPPPDLTCFKRVVVTKATAPEATPGVRREKGGGYTYLVSEAVREGGDDLTLR